MLKSANYYKRIYSFTSTYYGTMKFRPYTFGITTC